MEKEIKVGDKTFKVRELLAIELDDIDFTDEKESVKKQVCLSTSISEEEYKKLTVRERLAIIKCMSELNGFQEAN